MLNTIIVIIGTESPALKDNVSNPTTFCKISITNTCTKYIPKLYWANAQIIFLNLLLI